ncbi:unnamed protein product, partial [Lymnaea stagnalis]
MQDPSNNDPFAGDPWPQHEIPEPIMEENGVRSGASDNSHGESEKEQLLGGTNGAGPDAKGDHINESSFEVNAPSNRGKPPLFNILNTRLQSHQKDDKAKGSNNEHATESERHVSFKTDDNYEKLDSEPIEFVFLPKKAAKFGRGSSSTDFFEHLLQEKDDPFDDETDSPELPHAVGSIQTKDTIENLQEKQEHKISYGILKSEQGNRSFLKDRLTASLRGKQSSAPVKGSEKSPLLGKHSSPESPVSLINSSHPRHSLKDEETPNLSSPTRSYNSSEDDSQFHNISEDTDQHPSPSILSEEGEGVCSKYSQLSDHGSSTSSPLTSGENGEK